MPAIDHRRCASKCPQLYRSQNFQTGALRSAREGGSPDSASRYRSWQPIGRMEGWLGREQDGCAADP